MRNGGPDGCLVVVSGDLKRYASAAGIADTLQGALDDWARCEPQLKTLAARGDQFRPGDVVMHNDAYSGASHGPDVAFIVPVFVHGRLIGFAATTAHHLDIGALSPGSCGIVEAIDACATARRGACVTPCGGPDSKEH